MKKRIIGVTGGVCSGKSTVCKHLGENGYHVMDADKYGHKAYEKGSDCLKKVVSTFGDKILNENGEINRRELGKIVFSSKDEMKKLTDIVWPEISRLIRKDVELLEVELKENILVIEAAVLVEAKWYEFMSEVWVLNCPREVSIKRLMKRNKKTREDAEKVLNSQISNEERLKHADFVIDSDVFSGRNEEESSFWDRKTKKKIE